MGSEYVKEVSIIGYKMENNDDKAKYKCETKDGNYEKIKRHLIVGLEEYNI